ncbi:helix-turn-helix transcriptional regulator [Halopiger djelfimassiliensis]|uniref:helix-turn-helix transcriptional regulator n=1 Tax=Halopiger djelfimassiliensis TaxID=1293047 RepID=UPI0009DB85F5|nr:hypothetical protein [Halopiger djelfimassiliensis]
MRLSTAVTLALTALFVTSTVGAVAVTATPTSTATASVQTSEPPLESEPAVAPPTSPLSPAEPATVRSPTMTASSGQSVLEPADPKTVFRINVSADGDARWYIETRFRLTDDDDTELFFEYADAVIAGNRDVEYDTRQFDPWVTHAKRETGREMSIVDAGWEQPKTVEPDPETEPDNEDLRIGVISYSFTWTNFATADDDRVYFGDAFRKDDGTWMGLSSDQRLVVESPPNYGLETPTQLVWDGPHQFEADELEIVFLRGAGNSLLQGTGWLLAGTLVALAAGMGAYLAYRYLRGSDADVELPLERLPIGGSVSDEAETGNGTDSRTEDATPAGSEPADAAAGSDESAAHLGYDESVDEEIDPELLSDEERVHRLLKQNGGRMKQANIVTETGWSNAKVSQLLSQMDEDGEIEKLRIGRENLITLPEVDPTEID